MTDTRPAIGKFVGGPLDGDLLVLGAGASREYRVPAQPDVAELALGKGRPAGEPFAGGELLYRRDVELEPLRDVPIWRYVFEGVAP